MTVQTPSITTATTTATPLSYDRNGAGEPLLLIHGLGSDRHVWDTILDPLTDRYDVIRVDLPGHGESPRLAPGFDASADGMKAVVEQLLDELGIDRVHIAGSSLGGWVALELARAGRARSVTAFAPAGFWASSLVPVIAHANRWAARAVVPLASPLLRITPLRAIGFWSSSADPASLDPDVATRATHAQATASGWAAALAATHNNRCMARDIAPNTPVTVVWGDRDRILPAASCQRRDELPEHARWLRLRHCGHVPMWDQPARSVQIIEETADSAVPDQVASTIRHQP